LTLKQSKRGERLVVAKVKCITCDTFIESVHRHDFKWCNCPHDSDTRIFIDGGNDYIRMGFGDKALWEFVDD
jgi:hypothetical protein